MRYRLTNTDSRAKLLRLSGGDVTLAPGASVVTADPIDAAFLARVLIEVAVADDDLSPPRKRGRPRKGQAHG